jgi:SCO1/SenC
VGILGVGLLTCTLARLAVVCLAATTILLVSSAAAEPRMVFKLTTQNGTAFTDRDINGKPIAIFFGFTSCPDNHTAAVFLLDGEDEYVGALTGKIATVAVALAHPSSG